MWDITKRIQEYITYGGCKQVRRILEFLYKDATIYLDRKFLLATHMMGKEVSNSVQHAV